MNKQKLLILEKAFGAEIEDALGDGIGLLQTKSKLAIELVSEGMLEAKTVTLPGRAFLLFAKVL